MIFTVRFFFVCGCAGGMWLWFDVHQRRCKVARLRAWFLIVRESSLFEAFESNEKPVRGYLLGDSAYKLRDWLMTPLSNPTTRKEKNYNFSQSPQEPLLNAASESQRDVGTQSDWRLRFWRLQWSKSRRGHALPQEKLSETDSSTTTFDGQTKSICTFSCPFNWTQTTVYLHTYNVLIYAGKQ